jgi:hypothetical protein
VLQRLDGSFPAQAIQAPEQKTIELSPRTGEFLR